jgi:hypothetical protein
MVTQKKNEIEMWKYDLSEEVSVYVSSFAASALAFTTTSTPPRGIAYNLPFHLKGYKLQVYGGGEVRRRMSSTMANAIVQRQPIKYFVERWVALMKLAKN